MLLALATTPAAGRGLHAACAAPAGADLHTAPPLAHAVTSPAACAACGRAPPPLPLPPHAHCQGCRAARYCSRACQASDWGAHRHECAPLRAAAARGVALSPALRLVARMLRAAPAAAAAAAAQPVSDGPLADAERLAALERAPGALLRLADNYALHSQADLAAYAALCPALLLLLQGQQPQCTPRAALAMCARARCSAFALCDGELQPFGLGAFGVGGAANHSCAPNALAHFEPVPPGSGGRGGGLQQRLRATAPLAAGEAVTLAYIDVGAPTHLRRAELRRGYFFSCACARCAAMAAVEAQLLEAARQAGGGARLQLTALPLLPLDGAAAGEAPAEAPAAALPPWRFAQAHSAQDLAMLSVPCSAFCPQRPAGAAPCPGALLCVPSVEEGERGEGGGAGAGAGEGESEGEALPAAADAAAAAAPAPPAALQLYAAPCAACGAAMDPLRAARLRALFAAVAALRVRSAPRAGAGVGTALAPLAPPLAASAAAAAAAASASPPRRHLAACLAALQEARALALPATHYLHFSAAQAAAHAGVEAEAWGAAAEAAGAAEEGLARAYPPGHPLPALHAAMLGKLYHFLEAPARAVPCLERALAALARSHGSEHPLCQDLRQRLSEACQEASARV